MTPNFSVAALLLAAAVLVLLPLLPSLVELKFKSDIKPLNVVQQHAGEVGYFAESFRAYLSALKPALEKCALTGTTEIGEMPDGAEYLVLGRGEDALTLPLRRPDGSCSIFLACSTTLLVPNDITFTRDIYVNGDFIGGQGNQYRAVLAEKQIHLAPRSRILRWTHAREGLIANSDCQLLGRVSSDKSIRLATKCQFVRLNAPRIEIGSSQNATNPSLPERIVNLASRRVLHHGDFVLGRGEVFRGDLVVRGKLRIGEGARIYGSIKSEKDMVLETAVVVNGSLVSERKMRIGPRCLLYGPVIAERDMFIATGVRCGGLEHQTTVSARRIAVQDGAVIFGTLWAREQGHVVAKT
jgi:predicted acyltransferase (DUF342 family)